MAGVGGQLFVEFLKYYVRDGDVEEMKIRFLQHPQGLLGNQKTPLHRHPTDPVHLRKCQTLTFASKQIYIYCKFLIFVHQKMNCRLYMDYL